MNFFQPSFKLAEKERDGARVRKRYHPPATPAQRLLTDPRTPEEVRLPDPGMQATLDPVALLSEMRVGTAATGRDRRSADAAGPAASPAPTLEEFLAGLRTAWQER